MTWVKAKKYNELIAQRNPSKDIEAADFNSPLKELNHECSGGTVVESYPAMDQDSYDIAESLRRLEDKEDATVSLSDLRKELGL